MIETGDDLSPAEIERIADLHVHSVDDSVPTMVGGRCAEMVFRFLVRSDREVVFVERIDGRVESCCVVSLDPASLNRRLVRASLPRLAWDAGVALLTRPTFRRYLLSRIRELVVGDENHTLAPEITYVFTNERLRSRGIGRRMIDRVDAFFRARGNQAYYVRTIDAPDNRALAFYDRNGFVRIGKRKEGGRSFVEFERLLASS